MKLSPGFLLVIFSLTAECAFIDSAFQGKTFFGGLNGFTASLPGKNEATPVKFVPLISFLGDFISNFFSKFVQFNGVNANNRRFDVAETMKQNATESSSGDVLENDELNEDDTETELVECDGLHLGLWPDKSNSQKYYKCEVDPRTSASASCIKDYFLRKGTTRESENWIQSDRFYIPGVKPCFKLTILKCANGFKYSHKARICVPDIVFGSM